MEADYTTSLPYIVTNIVAVFVVISAMLWPTISRILFGIIFVAASGFNLFLAIQNPTAYLAFGELTVSSFYKSFILGPFSDNVQLYVIAIAIGQAMVGIFVCYRGLLMKLAMVGGIIFLLAISPLGAGSAFPAPLIMALALVILLGKRIDLNVYEILHRRSNYSIR